MKLANVNQINPPFIGLLISFAVVLYNNILAYSYIINLWEAI